MCSELMLAWVKETVKERRGGQNKICKNVDARFRTNLTEKLVIELRHSSFSSFPIANSRIFSLYNLPATVRLMGSTFSSLLMLRRSSSEASRNVFDERR